jgi:hypothetical protein
VAGYPNLSIPVGLTPEGKPAGLWMYSRFLKEPTLLALAYDLEQAIKPRTQPQFLGSVPLEPPDAGICATLTAAAAPKLVNGRAKTSASHWIWNASRQENQRLSFVRSSVRSRGNIIDRKASPTSENVRTARSNGVSLATPA